MPTHTQQQTAAGTKRCAQCGRVGTRGFKTIGPTFHEPTGYTIEAIVVCASSEACRKRWPKPIRDIYEER